MGALCVKVAMDYAKYHYEETLKLLVIISSSAEVQREAHGIGSAEEEMAIDLEFHFKENENCLIENGFITRDEADAISKIDQFFDRRSNSDDDDFWYDLENHEDWISLRIIANDVLKFMGKDHLEVDIKIENSTSWFSRNVTSQRIEISLVGKYT